MSVAGARKRVLIIGQLDGFANGQKPAEIERFLRSRGHAVEIANTYYLGRASSDPNSILRKLPAPTPMALALYLVQLATRLFTRRWKFGRRHLTYYLARADLRLRKSFLGRSLSLDEFDMVIGEHPNESELMTAETSARVLYDCVTPWADELYFEGRLTDRQREKMRRHEAWILDSVDHLSFGWQTYGTYSVKHYGIRGDNFVQLDWGCTPIRNPVEFRHPPRVVFMSSMSSRFINLPLLSRLAKLYPIDVYGGPPPDPELGLNYLGWAPPSVLGDYQIALITCSTDELRRDGFSAKNMTYVSYGLPVLIPAWRRHMELIKGCVPYEEDTFTAAIDRLSDPEVWQRVSDEAYAQAEELSWERTLAPLERALEDPSYRYLTPYMRSALGRS
jgi:hypothetical protein